MLCVALAPSPDALRPITWGTQSVRTSFPRSGVRTRGRLNGYTFVISEGPCSKVTSPDYITPEGSLQTCCNPALVMLHYGSFHEVQP